MSELRVHSWLDEPIAGDAANPSRRAPSKPPVTNIKVWLDCYARMVSILCTRFPQKAPESWAYQATIMKAAHHYEGSNWVSYDRQFRRDMLARKDLNWSMPKARLYNEAFIGRAKSAPCCPHCLCEDHSGSHCPHNPSPLVVGWITDTQPFFALSPESGTLPQSLPGTGSARPMSVHPMSLSACVQ